MRMPPSKEILVATSTFIGASLSMFGSIFIIQNIVRKKKYANGTYHRLLMGTSCCDLLSSVGWMMAPFAAPRADTNSVSPRLLSIGNVHSCTVCAFLATWSVGFMIYTSCLGIYFMQLICFNMTKARIAKREWIMHAVSILFSCFASITPVPLELYNELAVGSGCWVGNFPQECDERSDIECIRGGGKMKSFIVGNIIGGIPMILSIFIVSVTNTLIYRSVRQSELRLRRYRHSTTERFARRTTATAQQAMAFVFIFANSIFWQLLLRMLDGIDIITGENEDSWTALILIAQFFSASAGFGFLIVYVRPRYLRVMENSSESMTRFQGILISLSLRLQEPRHERTVAPDTNGQSRAGISNASDAEQCPDDEMMEDEIPISVQ